jgi:hypothetical protein
MSDRLAGASHDGVLLVKLTSLHQDMLLHVCTYFVPHDLGRLACVSRCFGAQSNGSRAFAGQIRELSLQGVDDIGKLKGLSYSGADACIRTDFFEPAGVELISVADGGLDSPVKMVLARFPNLVEPPTPHNWADFFGPNNTVRAMTVNASASHALAAWVLPPGSRFF